MIQFPIRRRRFLAGAGALAAAITLPLDSLAAAAAEELRPAKLPPPISSAERLQRLRRTGGPAACLAVHPAPDRAPGRGQ